MTSRSDAVAVEAERRLRAETRDRLERAAVAIAAGLVVGHSVTGTDAAKRVAEQAVATARELIDEIDRVTS